MRTDLEKIRRGGAAIGPCMPEGEGAIALADQRARRRADAAALARIDAALDRLAGGRYGYCTSCGARIEIARLEEDPAAALCGKCCG